MTTVAVIVTCRNLGRTLEEAVASARAQGPRVAEVVVVDDESDDAFTQQVLARVEAAGTRVIRIEHAGVSAARNLGVRNTTAPYVTFLDADDCFGDGYLAEAVQALDTDPGIAFVTCGMIAYEGGGAVWHPSVDLVDGLVRGHVHVSSVIRREAFDSAGGFDTRLPGLEDAALFTTLVARGARGAVVDTPGLRYRVRRQSRTSSALDTSAYQASVAAIVAANRPALSPRWRALLLTAADHVVEQRAHAKTLAGQVDGLRAANTTVRARIEEERRRLVASGRPPIGFGDLQRTTPLSPAWGLERGQPIDRVYIEAFLEQHATDIRGRVLEVKDPGYSMRYGGGRVTETAVLDVDPSNANATIVGDLADSRTLGADRFDCVVLTQVLNVIFDPRAALANAIRALKPGGVLLCTVSALNRVSCEEGGDDGDYWRFTEAALRRMCAGVLPPEAFSVEGRGNVFSCAAFLYGLAAHEVNVEDLQAADPAFPLVVTLRAVKPAQPSVALPIRPAAAGRGLVLFYHRIASFTPDLHGLCVDPTLFDVHLRWLREHFDVLPLEELAVRAIDGTLERDAVAITLDDGSIDHLETVAPAATALGLPLTYFVTTAPLATTTELWWDTLEHLLLEGNDRPGELSLRLDGAMRRWDTSTLAGRLAAHDALAASCYIADAPTRMALLRDLSCWASRPIPVRPSRRALSTGEVASLARHARSTIGSHTVNHLDLLAQRREVVVGELVESRLALEAEIGQPVRALSYPYGNADAATAAIAAAAGYAFAFTVEGRAIDAGDRPHLLPRLGVGAWSLTELADRTSAAFAAAPAHLT